ncbi:MAG: hypothetical protein Kow00103_07210 [Candidatus Caldatribacteriota bacterium]
MKKIKDKDVIVGLIIFLIGSYILIESIKLFSIGEYYDSPGLLPAIISIIIIFGSLILIWNSFKVQFKKTAEIREEKNDTEINKEPLFNLRIVIVILIITLYIFALSYTSFLIASIPFLFILMYYLKSTNLFKITLISVVVPLLIQFLFKNIFNQIIP